MAAPSADLFSRNFRSFPGCAKKNSLRQMHGFTWLKSRFNLGFTAYLTCLVLQSEGFLLSRPLARVPEPRTFKVTVTMNMVSAGSGDVFVPWRKTPLGTETM